jgi:hypothetical protein
MARCVRPCSVAVGCVSAGLRESGLVEGRDVVIELRYARRIAHLVAPDQLVLGAAA